MKKAQFFALFALLITGIWLQSCSPSDPDDKGSSSSRGTGGPASPSGNSSSSVVTYAFCIFETDKECLNGPLSACPSGSTPSNTCPYNSSSNSNGSGSSGSSSSGNSNGSGSSSSAASQSYAFCVLNDIQQCSPGPYTRCPGGVGELRDDCPFNDTSCSEDPECWELIVETKVYGEDLIDTRNNKTYKTVVIDGKTWMAANLNWEPTSPKGLTKCYAEGGGNGEDEWLLPEAAKPNCEKFGRLYDWVTAMDLSKNCNTSSCGQQVNAKHQGVCPKGWHIPSRIEWNALKDHISDVIWWNYEDEDYDWDVGTKLKATSGWKAHSVYGNGVDTYGFNAIGSGYCANCTNAGLNTAQGYYSDTTSQAHWWSATEYVNTNLTTNNAKEAYKFEVTYDKNVMNEKHVSKEEYLYSVRCVKD